MAKEKKEMAKEELYKKFEKLKILETLEDTPETKYEKNVLYEELLKEAEMLSPEDKKAFYKNLGDHALETDELFWAKEAYDKIGDKEGLKKVGDRWYEGEFGPPKIPNALHAYAKAGFKEGVIKLGKIAEKMHREDWAIPAYVEAGCIDELNRLADKYIEEGRFWKAHEIYRKLGKELSKEQLIKIGDRAIEKALSLWEKGVKGLSPEEVKGICKSYFDDADRAYGLAGNWWEGEGWDERKDKLIKIGDKFLEEGETKLAYDAYLYAGPKEPGVRERLIKVGDKFLEEGNSFYAVRAYEEAGCEEGTPEEIKKVADALEKEGLVTVAAELRKKLEKKKATV